MTLPSACIVAFQLMIDEDGWAEAYLFDENPLISNVSKLTARDIATYVWPTLQLAQIETNSAYLQQRSCSSQF